MTALPISTLRKPKRRRIGGAANFMAIAPIAATKVIDARLERRHAEADLEHQRQQERRRADADAEQERADDRWRGSVGMRSSDRSRIGFGTRRRVEDIGEQQGRRRRAARSSVSAGGMMPRPSAVEPVMKPARPSADSMKPSVVEAGARVAADVRDVERREDQAEDADRDVDPEDPAPVEIGGDEAAERRAERPGRSAPAWSARRASRRARASGRICRITSRPTGTIIAPPMPCTIAGARRAPRSSPTGRRGSSRA